MIVSSAVCSGRYSHGAIRLVQPLSTDNVTEVSDGQDRDDAGLVAVSERSGFRVQHPVDIATASAR